MRHKYKCLSSKVWFLTKLFLFKSYYTYEKVEEISKFIKSKVNLKPKVAIICGSGLGNIAHLLNEKQILSYDDIPEFPRSTGASNHIYFKYTI
jgi:hypothetical protein